MHVLAIETIATTGSVAALADDRCLGEARLPLDRRSAQSLAPAIQELLARVGWQPGDVQLVAVAVGPGSFTGLRVGVTTAKVLAYAVGAEVMGINALEAIARQAPRPPSRLWTAIDAHRQQVFCAAFEPSPDGCPTWDGATRLLDIDAWLAALRPGDLASGPALRKLHERLPAGVTAAPEECWAPRAATMGRIAAQRRAAGERDDVWRLAPLYVRPSAAEEKVFGLRVEG